MSDGTGNYSGGSGNVGSGGGISSYDDLVLHKRLTVMGDTTLDQRVFVNGNLYINGTKVTNLSGLTGPTGPIGPVFSGNVTLINPVENITFDNDSFYYLNLTGVENYDTNVKGNVNIRNNIVVNGICKVNGNIASTSKTTGSLTIQGGVGITGSLYVGNALYVNGIHITSDYRIKTNIIDIDSTYSVDNLRVINYLNIETNKQEIGVFAHELQEHYPYLVTGDKDGGELQAVNYIGIIGILIKEVQLLKKKVYGL